MAVVLVLAMMMLATTGAAGSATSGLAVAVDADRRLAGAPAFRETASRAVQSPRASEAALELDRESRWQVQQRLRDEGFDPGPPDGLFGPRTRDAVRRWQESAGVLATGYLDRAAVELLFGAGDAVGAAPSPASEVATDIAPLVAEPSPPPIPTDVVADEVGGASERKVDTVEKSPAAPGPGPGPVQLPPEILVDRHLIRVERLLGADDHAGAYAVMQEIVALRDEHGVVLPDDFAFRYAQVAFGTTTQPPAGRDARTVGVVGQLRRQRCVWTGSERRIAVRSARAATVDRGRRRAGTMVLNAGSACRDVCYEP